jgi:hypothetical protein
MDLGEDLPDLEPELEELRNLIEELLGELG